MCIQPSNINEIFDYSQLTDDYYSVLCYCVDIPMTIDIQWYSVWYYSNYSVCWPRLTDYLLLLLICYCWCVDYSHLLIPIVIPVIASLLFQLLFIDYWYSMCVLFNCYSNYCVTNDDIIDIDPIDPLMMILFSVFSIIIDPLNSIIQWLLSNSIGIQWPIVTSDFHLLLLLLFDSILDIQLFNCVLFIQLSNSMVFSIIQLFRAHWWYSVDSFPDWYYWYWYWYWLFINDSVLLFNYCVLFQCHWLIVDLLFIDCYSLIYCYSSIIHWLLFIYWPLLILLLFNVCVDD